MIERLGLYGFKKFLNQQFDFAGLTVLTGLNASGKSTVLQALNLIHQAERDNSNIVRLVENPGLHLGSSSELVHYDNPEPLVRFEISSAAQTYRYSFDCSEGPSSGLPFVSVASRPADAPAVFSSVPSAYHYLAAERIGPRVSMPVSPAEPGRVEVGPDGRFVASVLATEARAEVPSGRRNAGAGDVSTLSAQVEAWLSEMLGPTQLEASLVPRTPTAILRIRRGGNYGEWMLPTNTGFGISYCLPIVVAALLVPAGGVLAIDSPEAHLHPAAQSAMGRFLSIVAADGVQVFVETHSDHVLNGVRRAASEGLGPGAGDTVVWYLGEGAPERIKISESGALDRWPSGFFDQITRDLHVITRRSIK